MNANVKNLIKIAVVAVAAVAIVNRTTQGKRLING